MRKLIKKILKKQYKDDLDYEREFYRLLDLYDDVKAERVAIEDVDIVDTILLIQLLDEEIEYKLKRGV